MEKLNFRINNKSTRNKDRSLINNISQYYLRSSLANILMTIGNTTVVNFSWF